MRVFGRDAETSGLRVINAPPSLLRLDTAPAHYLSVGLSLHTIVFPYSFRAGYVNIK